jgi:hypothetical protein
MHTGDSLYVEILCSFYDDCLGLYLLLSLRVLLLAPSAVLCHLLHNHAVGIFCMGGM